MEWEISFELLEVAPGRPYSASDAETAVGINIGIGDVDLRTGANGCCGFHHRQWLSGGPLLSGAWGETCINSSPACCYHAVAWPRPCMTIQRR